MTVALIVNQEIVINAGQDRVWEAVASEQGLRKWLGPQEYEARVGGKITFLVTLSDHQEFMFGQVVTYEPPHKLAFTWQQQVIGGETWPVATLVTITLTPQAGGTHVRLEHSGFEALPPHTAQDEFTGYVRGWEVRKVMERLKKIVEEAH